MAQQIINNLLNSEISPEDITNWLTSDNEDENWKHLDEICTKSDFAFYYLDFLKKQFTSLPEDTTNTKSSNIKPQKNVEANITKEDNDINAQISIANISTPNIKHNKEVSLHLESSDSTDNNQNNSVKTSTPVFKQQILTSTPKTAEKNNSISSPKENMRPENKSFHVSSKNFSQTSNKSLETAGTHKSHSFTIISKDSINMSNSDISSNDAINSRSCYSNNSITSFSEICGSPTSPLYNQGVSMMTPKNQIRNKNKSVNTSSKKNNSNKNGRFTPRQTISLADFITKDSGSTKKNNNNKKNSDNDKSKQNQEQSNNILVNDDTFPKIESNPRWKRRIKPTKLETVNNKGDDKQMPFGVIARPQTVNPTFVEVPPADKSTNNTTFEAERQLLKLERRKKPDEVLSCKEDCSETKTLNKTPSKIIPIGQQVIPSLNLVEKVETIDKLIKLYCAFWNHNLILNPMSELYFVIYLTTLQYTENVKTGLQKQKQTSSVVKSIIKVSESTNSKDHSLPNSENTKIDNSLTNIKFEDMSLKILKEDLGCANLIESNDFLSDDKKSAVEVKVNENLEDETKLKLEKNKEVDDKEEGDNKKKGLFDSPHNCVYFACCVLENQKHLLIALDRATLKLLAENNRIASFKPSLCQYLNEKYNLKLLGMQKAKQTYNAKLDESNVCFQVDTDNAEQFSSQKAFRIFHKQRDMFYEVFREWELNHIRPEWNMSVKLGVKIQNMLLLHNDMTNYYHFARLFKSQLLSSCLSNDQQEEPIDDENLSLLKTLKHLNLEKLTQLQGRLVKPLTSNGPVPIPTFYGKQEFFRDFLICSNNPMFYNHLQNCLVSEILELNETHFINNEIEDEEDFIDDYMKQLFIKSISSLRLLAKLLGFLLSLPYKSETNVSESVIASQISLRSQMMPPLNIQECLRNSIRQGRLSLTLPWIVEYLAMLDVTSLSLPYYVQILEFLYYIYRASETLHFKDNANFLSQQTIVLVKFSLGWLFELPNLPKHLYYSWQLNYSKQKLQNICYFAENETTALVSQVSKESQVILDKFDIIDDTALYLCCPFLTELKILLLTGNSNVNNTNSTRHITPVSSELRKETNDSKQLQMQLEEAFFNGQPSSTRKIVDFVSERVASSCIKYICHVILPKQREKVLKELQDLVKNTHGSNVLNSNEGKDEISQMKKKDSLRVDMITLSKTHSHKIKTQCQEVIYKMCESRITKCIEAMLPEDVLPQVKDTCIGIAIRMSMERVKKWILIHFVDDELFLKDMNAELNKILKNVDLKTDTCVEHDPEAISPTDAINLLRECILNLLEGRQMFLTLEIVSDVLHKIKLSLTKRKDLLPMPQNVLFALTVDLSLCLITYRPDLMTSNVQNLFIDFWKDPNLSSNITNILNDSPLTRILAPRNILLLEKSENKETWTTFALFMKKLLDNELLTIDNLSEQCVAVFRDEWSVMTLKNLSTFLMQVISDMNSLEQQEDTERIRTLLEWVAGAYNDIDFFD